LSWLQTVGEIGFEGQLPGIKDSFFSLSKKEGLYDGALTIGDQLYGFEKADLLHIAASVGVALNIAIDPLPEELQKKDLTALGKSIDLFVKSNILSEVKTQSKLVKAQPKESGKITRIKLSKAEALIDCNECDQKLFKNNVFTGCICLSALAPSIATETLPDGYVLKIGKSLDEDAIATLIQVFKDE
jgi:hypothetical protein